MKNEWLKKKQKKTGVKKLQILIFSCFFAALYAQLNIYSNNEEVLFMCFFTTTKKLNLFSKKIMYKLVFLRPHPLDFESAKYLSIPKETERSGK